MHVGHLTATTQNNSKEESWLHIAFLTNQRKTRTRNYFLCVYLFIYKLTNTMEIVFVKPFRLNGLNIVSPMEEI